MCLTIESYCLEELKAIENFSTRTYNICRANDLNDLESILNYYHKNNHFLGLYSCGQKYNEELKAICIKYKNYHICHNRIKFDNVITENSFRTKLDHLTNKKKQILNNIIIYKFEKLPKRYYKVLSPFKDPDDSVNGFYEQIAYPDYNFKNLRNVGFETEEFLKDFFNNIREDLENIYKLNDENELSIELFNSYLRRFFDIEKSILNEIWEDYNIENGLPLFKTLNILIIRGVLYSNKEKEVFEKSLKFWDDRDEYTLREISQTVGVCIERIRQIKRDLLFKRKEKFAFINGIELETINLYGIDLNADIVIISKEIVSIINEKEKNSFSHVFINLILSILFEESLDLVGNISSNAFNLSKLKGTKYVWKTTYLINKYLCNIFDFESFVNDIDIRLSKKIKEDYIIHYETYLHKFLLDISNINSDRLIPITEYILFSEFGISVNISGNIVFRKNINK